MNHACDQFNQINELNEKQSKNLGKNEAGKNNRIKITE